MSKNSVVHVPLQIRPGNELGDTFSQIVRHTKSKVMPHLKLQRDIERELSLCCTMPLYEEASKAGERCSFLYTVAKTKAINTENNKKNCAVVLDLSSALSTISVDRRACSFTSRPYTNCARAVQHQPSAA
ncbi:hypothetical protein KP509_25G029300 [Ceratopteris richardii]|uniref:Uncharacterized protein n=1 Tax=Ceratopteris richardii TaxID=49495 RepID=A0A8T2RQA9_CERRI|nr:hypothetical protein KP509_25G029300 [Ceratopteris richardii]